MFPQDKFTPTRNHKQKYKNKPMGKKINGNGINIHLTHPRKFE